MQTSSSHSFARSFLSIFPPPRFLRMPAAGLDVTDERVRFLEFKKGEGGLLIDRYGEVEIPPGTIVSGDIKKRDELRQVLSDFRKKYNISFVRVSLPEERAYLVTMDVPDVSDEEMRGAITFQLEEQVPLPASDVLFDYHVLGSSPTEKGKMSVAVSVFPKKDLEGYVEMFSGTGIVPVSFEIEAQAIARALIPAKDSGTYILIDFGGKRTGISIISDHVVRFTSTIDVGSRMITEAIQKSFNVSFEEAEKIKNERRISKSGNDKEFFAALSSSLSVLYDEVNKIYLYWHSHGGEKEKISKIILSGGGANLHGLSEYLGSSLRMKTFIGNPWANVNSFDSYVPQIPKNEALGYTSVIGLALRDAMEGEHI